MDFFYPKKCLECGRTGSYVCEKCEVGMWEEEQRCPSCGGRSVNGEKHARCADLGLEGVVSYLAFEGLTKRIIETAKVRQYFDVLDRIIPSRQEIEARADMGKFRQFVRNNPVVVPVPLWVGTEKKRGFNQAEIIAKKLAVNLELKKENLLVKVRDTGEQQGRTKQERADAVKGAFMIKNEINFKAVVIVDDVWATGATLRECGTVLKAAGVNEVWGWTLAG